MNSSSHNYCHRYKMQGTLIKKLHTKLSPTFLMNNISIVQYEVFDDIDRRGADNVKKVSQTLWLLYLTGLHNIYSWAKGSVICLHWIWFHLQYKQQLILWQKTRPCSQLIWMLICQHGYDWIHHQPHRRHCRHSTSPAVNYITTACHLYSVWIRSTVSGGTRWLSV